MITKTSHFNLTNTLRKGNSHNINIVSSFAKIVKVIPLYKKEKRDIIKDKELGICYESAISRQQYELEVKNAKVSLDRKLNKNQDFLRRMNYKYDWLQIEQNSKGEILHVSNLKKIRDNLTQLTEAIRKDYKGADVEMSLNNTTRAFEEDKHFLSIFDQYSEYGLLFPPISDHHNEKWKHERIVSLNSATDSEIIETINYEGIVNEEKIYTLTLEEKKNNPFVKVKNHKGLIKISTKTNAIRFANVKIEVLFGNNSISNIWEYQIEEVNI